MIRIRTASTLSAALIFAFSGCGPTDTPDETTNNSTQSNNPSDNNDDDNNDPSTNNEPSSNNASNNASNNGSTNNTTANTNPNNTTATNNGTNGPCDPTAVAAELLGSSDTAAEADFSAEALDPAGWSATLDASLGGPEPAAAGSWLYVDLDSAELLDLADADAWTDSTWDVAFKRAEIRINSGDSGPRGLLLHRVEETTWESVELPGMDAEWADGDFVADDCEVETYGRGSAATAFSDWYDYDPATHTVSAPAGVVYIMYDPADHSVTKFQINSYDDGLYDFRWAPATGAP